MADGELAIVIGGAREDWPGGPQTLTPREPTREPNGTLWFGAELDPAGGQVWFRIAEEAIGRMPAETPAGPRPPLGRRPHRVDHAGSLARARHQPLRGAGLGGRRHVDRTPAVVKMDPPAATRPAAALEGPAPSARRLVEASVSANTRRAYAGALRRLDAWLAGRRLEDATLAGYLAELHEQGRAPSSASTAVAAARFRARLAGEQSPAAERTARVLASYRRTAVGRGVESDDVALKRGQLDAVIAGLLFMAGMRRSEVSALLWGDVAEAAAGDGVLVTVRRGKTNPEGEARDVRFVKGDVAGAVRTLRDASSPSGAAVAADGGAAFPGGGPVGRRRAGDRPFGACRSGFGADAAWRVDDRRDAGRKLEDLSDGGALLGRSDGRTRSGGAVPLKPSLTGRRTSRRPPSASIGFDLRR